MASGYDPKGPIFISYRRSDGTQLAELLDNYLRAGGLVPWRDLVDLPPGETAQRVTEAFEEGISQAIFLVTPEINRSRFVAETEIPPLVELDQDQACAAPFRLHVVNTIPDPRVPGGIDVNAPMRLINGTGLWPPSSPDFAKAAQIDLANLKQYALLEDRVDLRQLLHDLLEARLTARVDTLADKEITIQTQTRPEGNAKSRMSGTNRRDFTAKDEDDPYDLTVRLRQDSKTDVPSELGLLCLKESLPLMVDAMFAHGVEKVKLGGGGHPSLLWAVGASLPTTRMATGNFQVLDIYGQAWHEGVPTKTEIEKASQPDGELLRGVAVEHQKQGRIDREQYQVSPSHTDRGLIPEEGLTRAAVLLEFGTMAKGAAFDAMADTLPRNCVTLKLTIEKRNGDAVMQRDRIPSVEGFRLAQSIIDHLRDLSAKGIDELHVVCAIPVAMAALLGRMTNTLTIVLHEWGVNWETRNREYLPVVRFEPGAANGPITRVYPQRRFFLETTQITELVNLTSHPVTLFSGGKEVKTWPAPADKDGWCRVAESASDLPTLRLDGEEAPLSLIEPGELVNVPERKAGVGYIVPRLTALKSSRDDFFFPAQETRDEKGTVNGCEVFGRYPVSDESAARWRRLLAVDAGHRKNSVAYQYGVGRVRRRRRRSGGN